MSEKADLGFLPSFKCTKKLIIGSEFTLSSLVEQKIHPIKTSIPAKKSQKLGGVTIKQLFTYIHIYSIHIV